MSQPGVATLRPNQTAPAAHHDAPSPRQHPLIWQSFVPVLALLALFMIVLSFLPLKSAIKIGADEDFELSKPILCLHGYHLYTEVWNDQPPLYTFLITQLLKHTSMSLAVPRLLTAGFAAVLLLSFYSLVWRLSGTAVAAVAGALLFASPGFIELACSCMQEVPALAPVIGALCVIASSSSPPALAVCAFLFACALQLKLIGIIYAPLFALLLSLHAWAASHVSWRGAARALLLRSASFGVALVLFFVAINLTTGNPLMVQLKQGWESHFSGPKVASFVLPAKFSFDWSVLAKNWDVTIPAILGIGILGYQSYRMWRGSAHNSRQLGRHFPDKDPAGRKTTLPLPFAPLALLLPLAWICLTLIVFPLHLPFVAERVYHKTRLAADISTEGAVTINAGPIPSA